jgi:hypothetical protein
MANKPSYLSFGEIIPGLAIDGKDAPYPVLNERDARAAAGLMLIAGIVAFIPALLFSNRLLLMVMVVIFGLEFFIRVLINPKFAPFYALGTFIVKHQRPEYSGAAQKRFAWSLGLSLAGVMVVILFGSAIFGFEVNRALPLSLCGLCLALLWFETSFGICIGCLMYQGLIKVGLIKKPEIMPACPGGACAFDPGK